MTLGTMADRIADELARTDLTTQITREIRSAIVHYQRRRFYFNEKVNTLSLVANQQWYSSSDLADIPNIVEIDKISITIGSTPYTLNPRTAQWMEDAYGGTSDTGDPTDYAYYRRQLRFYPIPSAVRTVTLNYVYQESEVTNTASTNHWFADAEELIRSRAMHKLYANVIRTEPDSEASWARSEAEALAQLETETTLRISSGTIRPGSF